MLTALVIASVLAGAGASAPAQGALSPADLIRTGCLGSNMTPDGLERVAGEHHWEGLLLLVRSQADIDRMNNNPNWETGYDAGSGWVRMSGPKSQGQVASTCTVTVEGPVGDWNAGFDRLASDLRLSPVVLEMPAGVEGAMWSAPDGRKLSVAYTAANRTLEVILSRPVVPASERH